MSGPRGILPAGRSAFARTGSRQTIERRKNHVPRLGRTMGATPRRADMSIQSLVLDAITFVASIVNGALGYGFSSITVPIALLVVVNRVLNPALVMIEVVLNAYVLFVNRGSLGLVWRRAMPVVLGLVPGVAIGTAILTRVDPAWLKLSTFVVLLPLILLQPAGFRRPIRAERSVGAAFGVGLGVLYSITTISGPPRAIL